MLLIAMASEPSLVAQAAPSRHDAAARRAARPFAEKGFELYSSGRYAESVEQFQRAEARYHAPPHLLYMARALWRLGRLVEARDLYRRILSERLGRSAPQAFHRALIEARAEFDEVSKRLPTVVLEISGASLDLALVAIDGRKYGALPESIALDPGEHTIEVSAPDVVTQSRTITLRPGETRRIPIELSLAAAASAENRLLVPAMICFGVGGASLLVSAITGGVSLSQAADVDDQCQGDHCPASLEGDADRATAIGHASTATFVIGLASTAAGATLLIVGGPSSQERSASVRLRASAGGLAMVGAF